MGGGPSKDWADMLAGVVVIAFFGVISLVTFLVLDFFFGS